MIKLKLLLLFLLVFNSLLTTKLIIWVGIHKYKFNGQTLRWSKLLAKLEIDWLVYELTKWLSMPITRE
jgi:hypothetical protein